ncbi:MAG: iron-containing alcohol dehydrogenase [Sphingobium sp.]
MMRAASVAGSAIERVALGMPAAAVILEEAEARGARRVFLLVGSHLARETDEIERIAHALGSRHAATHWGIGAHVPKMDLLAASNRALDVDADMIVVVGGGSLADAGKILALCLRHQVRTAADLDPLRVRYDAAGRVVSELVAGPDVRVIVVPTTLSAGEFNPLSGLTDEASGQKQGFTHPAMTPACIIFDPSITLHTPEWLWLSTGVRAVDHAVETLVSLRSNDHADGLAESGLRLLTNALPQVKATPADLDARLKCQIGAWHAILPIIGGVPMGASHAIGHALGGYCGVPHGYTSCVMAPTVQIWNAAVETHGHDRAAACFGDRGNGLGASLDAFIRGLGLPRWLAEVGVDPADHPMIARYAFQDIWGRTNPRLVQSADDMLTLLRRASGIQG